MTLLPPEVAFLAQLGLRCFPLCRHDDLSFEVRDRGKAPWRGFTDWPNRATSDLAQLETWAVEYPGCNWGMATGQGSYIVVIDEDGEEGRIAKAALEEQGFLFPSTFEVLTGRSDAGVHRYYRVAPGVEVRNNNSGKIGPHIDVRGDNGYVVAPGSTHVSERQYKIVNPGAEFADLPDWVIERLRRPAPPPAPESDAADDKVRHPNRHNYLVSLAGTMRKRGMSLDAMTAALLAENVAKCDPPLDEQEVRVEIAADIFRRYAPGTADGDAFAAAILDPRPKVRLPGDNYLLSTTATQLSEHLADKSIFVRNDDTVRCDGSDLKIVSPQTFRTLVEQHVVCYRKRKAGDGTYDVGITMTDCESRGVLAAPQFTASMRRLRRLNLCRRPVFRADGGLELLPEGYDLATQTLTISTASFADDMPLNDALAAIDNLLGEFRFADKDRSKAVAVAAMVGLFAAQLLPSGSRGPCFIIRKNDAGAGGSTMAAAIVAPVFGSAPMQTAPEDETEMKKVIATVRREAQQVLILDNQKGKLSSKSLESFISETIGTDRLLGVNQSFTGENLATVMVTSNGGTFSADMRRRSLFIELHLEEETPEERKFERSLKAIALAALRPQMLATCWALVRNWDAKGRPGPSRTHSSFDDWATVVAGIVEAAGFACPLAPPELKAVVDEEAEDMRTLAAAMTPGRLYTFAEMVELCRVNECCTRLVSEGELKPSARSGLGFLFARHDDRRVKNFRFHIEGRGRARRFRVEVVMPPPDHPPPNTAASAPQNEPPAAPTRTTPAETSDGDNQNEDADWGRI